MTFPSLFPESRWWKSLELIALQHPAWHQLPAEMISLFCWQPARQLSIHVAVCVPKNHPANKIWEHVSLNGLKCIERKPAFLFIVDFTVQFCESHWLFLFSNSNKEMCIPNQAQTSILLQWTMQQRKTSLLVKGHPLLSYTHLKLTVNVYIQIQKLVQNLFSSLKCDSIYCYLNISLPLTEKFKTSKVSFHCCHHSDYQ